ncbi:MAG TPA: Nudix family hydrolase, partial [Marinobacter sp.]|nr:Nudix family hydrolase [Marinobacter sp.]
MQAIHVAVGVVTDNQGRILIAKRAAGAHQGGLWEFPGGKVERKETVQQALERELLEELGVTTGNFTPLIQIAHDYGDKAVLLDVYRAHIQKGEAHGREGQPLKWVTPDELNSYTFPAANRPIVSAITLPERLLITGAFTHHSDFLQKLSAALSQGITLVQLRAPELKSAEFMLLAAEVQRECERRGVRLLLNTDPDINKAVHLHLNSARLMQTHSRPLAPGYLLGASCHNAEQILHANTLAVDYICLSPVKATNSHPQITPLGWDNFAEFTRLAAAPVYALGGMKEHDIATAINHGGQGIASISAW